MSLANKFDDALLIFCLVLALASAAVATIAVKNQVIATLAANRSQFAYESMREEVEGLHRTLAGKADNSYVCRRKGK